MNGKLSAECTQYVFRESGTIIFWKQEPGTVILFKEIREFGNSIREAGLARIDKVVLDSALASFDVPHFGIKICIQTPEHEQNPIMNCSRACNGL